MIPRTITEKLLYYTNKYPIVTLTGPRQSGKSTLLKNSFPDFHYVSLEDPDTLFRIKEDPRFFIRNYPDKTIIDEAQRFPELMSYLQTHVDDIGHERMYMLSGSHNFLLMQSISQSLAGRTATMKLLPFSFDEINASRKDLSTIDQWIFRGLYPRIYDKDIHPTEFYPFYIQTYVERDVRQLKNITNISSFIHFIKLCAGRIGQLLNLSNIANECGISQTTAKSWLSALEASYVVYLLKPHYKNFNKRLVKTPKLYFYDTGLACSLLGINKEAQLLTHYLRGALFENWVIMEYQKSKYNQGLEPQLFFWRDNTGNEIDLIMEEDDQMIPVEIKSGITYHSDFFKGLKYWQRVSSDSKGKGAVVYGGDESFETPNGKLISWKNWGNNDYTFEKWKL